ncbi:ATP-binding protein [Clostridium felsineum]|uniref:ATP-binding protein n=1 Tax=Clostridium felsineum TaxID=36839 RepID=UPI00098C119A|nr:ATP-binding protein [Clostridium felsineum]URZ04354.1 ATP-dependent zinc metalloprotease FtsH [Clostridium felsineum]
MDELEILINALSVSPENSVLRKHVAELQFKKGLFEEALLNFNIVLAEEFNFETLECKLNCLVSLERFDEAKTIVDEEMDPEENWANGHVILSKCFFHNKEYKNALKSYEKAVELLPELKDDEFYKKIKEFDPREKLRELQGNTVEEEHEIYNDFSIDKPKRNMVTFQDVGGMEKAKESININIIFPLKNPEFFKAYGKKAGGGILLYGPPGCGKTFMAQATAGECNANFTNISITDILDMYIGESEKNLHSIFENARRYKPAVIFIDEIDAIGGKRQSMSSSASRSLTNQLLVEMDSTQSDNENLLVIGATNTPWQVDSALRRPGRFDRILFIQPPDFKARVEILKLHLKDKPCENIDYERIAKKLVKYSGADIKAICDVASENVIKIAMAKGKILPITTKDLNEAVKQVKPSTIEWLNTAKNYATYSNQSGIYDEVIEYLKSAD